MGYRWTLLVGVTLLVAGQIGRASAPARQVELIPSAVAEEFVQAYNAHDAERLVELFAENVEIVVPDLTTVKGKPDHLKYYKAWFASVPDVRVAVISTTVEDDRFVLELSETGTYRKRLPTATAPRARGQKLAYPWVIIAKVANGKIIRARIYENDLIVDRQLRSSSCRAAALTSLCLCDKLQRPQPCAGPHTHTPNGDSPSRCLR